MIPEAVSAKFCKKVLSTYDLSEGDYLGALVRIEGLKCGIHGIFSQYASQLRKPDGAHCPSCGDEKRKVTRMVPVDTFCKRAVEAHGGRYTYEECGFTVMNAPISVTCSLHGKYIVSANKHIYALQGCPTCANSTRGHRKNVMESAKKTAASKIEYAAYYFADKANDVHGGKYDYSKVQYVNAREKVEIVCSTHGPFFQNPWNHVHQGYGCPSCGNVLSRVEDEVANYLAMFTTVRQRDRSTIGPKELDVYLPDNQIAVEYCGMYWHSHFDAEDERKNKGNHYFKYNACRDKGIRLITIYEVEWKERRHAIMRLLRNAVGKTRGKLMARKCVLSKVPHQDAVAFYEKYHPQGGAGNGEHYGLYWNTKLVACMRFTLGANDRGAAANNRTWTLTRYATRVTVAGAASRLMKAFVAEYNPDAVKSFSDNRYFSGDMYKALGFRLDTELSPDYQVWSRKGGLRSKSHYQRRLLQARLDEHSVNDRYDHEVDPRTEQEMTHIIGAGRIYDCGKKRWLWTAP